MDTKLHTPEGLRDIYNSEFQRKKILLSRLIEKIESFGYEGIQTPTFEFFDVFSKEKGTIPSKDLYKFFDREGNTLVLRPDFTPAIARACATYFDEESMPKRLYYNGNVFVNHSANRGRLKENTQVGCEFVGESSVLSDGEILTLCVECLLSTGLKDFQISMNDSALFENLLYYGNLQEEEENLREVLLSKNFFLYEEILDEKGITGDLKKLFMLLTKMCNSPEDFKESLPLCENYPKVKDTFSYLTELYEICRAYGSAEYISFEFGLVSRFQYYTGVIFSGYTYGTGEPILNGGRYDKLLDCYGRDIPAIGFGLDTDSLLSALERQKIDLLSGAEKIQVLSYNDSNRLDQIKKAQALRKEGACVELRREDKA